MNSPTREGLGFGSIARLRSLELGVTDLARSVEFYRDVWALAVVAEEDGVCCLRATGPDHHVVTLRERPQPALLATEFVAADSGVVDRLHAALVRTGTQVLGTPQPRRAPGGGYGFAFRDPEARELRVFSDVATHADARPAPDRPFKLSHVVLNAKDADREGAFLVDALGFRLSDRTAMMDFYRCNADHHSVALVRTGNVSLNHIAFEMPDWNAVMRGAGRLKEAGFAVEWGIGRHGPGDNVFSYFIDPNGFVVEYTAEVQQIDELLHRPGTPQEWERPANRLDQWGFAGAPNERVRAAMHGAGQAGVQ